MRKEEKEQNFFHKIKDFSKQTAQAAAIAAAGAASAVKESVQASKEKAESKAEEKKKAEEQEQLKKAQEKDAAMKTLRAAGMEAFYLLLGDSPIRLTAAKSDQIKTVFPIPKEQYLLWVDAEFDLHPSGIAVTDSGIWIRTNVNRSDEKNTLDCIQLDQMTAEEQQAYIHHFAKFHSGKSVLLSFPWETFNPCDFTDDVEIRNIAQLVEPQCSKRFIAACRKYAGLDTANPASDAAKQKIQAKLGDLLYQAVLEYNDAYARMNANGTELYVARTRSTDLIQNIENLVNSIAHHSKSFDAEFSEIDSNRKAFQDASDFAKAELDLAKKSVLGAGAGIAAGAAIVSVAPSAAMWVATTFGTASTGTAISALSGAAAKSAALAWLGGGALHVGGGGMAAGSSLLALAGPIGMTIAGATLLASISLFTVGKFKHSKQKKEELEAVLRNTKEVRILSEKMQVLIDENNLLRENLSKLYTESMQAFGKDFLSLPVEQQMKLGTLVNNTKALSASLRKGVQ